MRDNMEVPFACICFYYTTAVSQRSNIARVFPTLGIASGHEKSRHSIRHAPRLTTNQTGASRLQETRAATRTVVSR
jgi:hypothetical protein